MHHARTRGPSWAGAATVVAVAGALVCACTTSMVPVKCTDRPYRCVEDTDVKFCESEVLSIDGAGCDALGLAPSKRFCFVTPAHRTCVGTNYEVKGRDCRILEYRNVREWRECSEGTPTFAAP